MHSISEDEAEQPAQARCNSTESVHSLLSLSGSFVGAATGIYKHRFTNSSQRVVRLLIHEDPEGIITKNISNSSTIGVVGGGVAHGGSQGSVAAVIRSDSARPPQDRTLQPSAVIEVQANSRTVFVTAGFPETISEKTIYRVFWHFRGAPHSEHSTILERHFTEAIHTYTSLDDACKHCGGNTGEEIANLNEQVSQLELRLQDEKQRSGERVAELENMAGDLRELKEKLRTDLESSGKEATALNKQISELERMLQAEKQHSGTRVAELQKIVGVLQSKQVTVEKKENDLEQKLRTNLGKSGEEAAVITKKISNLELKLQGEKAELENMIHKLRTNLDALQREQTKLQNRNDELAANLDKLQKRCCACM